MIAEYGFLIFSVIYLIVIGAESFFLFRSHQNKKVLTARIRNAQRSYENRSKHIESKLQEAIQEREQKIKELEKQLVLLKNDEEKQVLKKKVLYLESEIQALRDKLEALRSRGLLNQESSNINPEEYFQIKERTVALEFQIAEQTAKIERLTQEQSLLQEQLFAEQTRAHQLQQELAQYQGENIQLKEERDLLKTEYRLLEKHSS